MLTKIIFQDGTSASIQDAAQMIRNHIRPGLQSNLKAIYKDEMSEFETFVFWRYYAGTFRFESSSGTILASVKI